LAGTRDEYGTYEGIGRFGYYWSSTARINNTNSLMLSISLSYSSMNGRSRANGKSVRCIKN